MYPRAPSLEAAWSGSSIIGAFIYSIFLLNQATYGGSISPFPPIRSDPEGTTLRPNTNSTQAAASATNRPIVVKRFDEAENVLAIKVVREPTTLIDRLAKVREVRSERFRGFQETLKDKIDNVRNRNQQTPDVYKLNIDLPVYSPTAASTSSDNNAIDDGANAATMPQNGLPGNDHQSNAGYHEQVAEEEGEQDGMQDSESKSQLQLATNGNDYKSKGGFLDGRHVGSPIAKLKRALRDVANRAQGVESGNTAMGAGVSSLVNHETVTGGSQMHISHDAPIVLHQYPMQEQPIVMVPASQLPTTQFGAEQLPVGLIHHQDTLRSSAQDLQMNGGDAGPFIGDSLATGTMWLENHDNNNNKRESHRPQLYDFGRRNVPSTNAAKLQQSKTIEHIPELPMDPINAHPFNVDHTQSGKERSQFDDDGLATGNTNQNRKLKAAESYDHITKCDEHKEGDYEIVEPEKKVENHHHHHHHHHHHEQKKKEVLKGTAKHQLPTQPVHLEIHIKGKSKGKKKGKSKGKGKGKGKGKVKGKNGEEVYIKLDSGYKHRDGDYGGAHHHEEYQKANDGQGIEDKKSLIGDAESDGGGGGSGQSEGNKPALASAAPISSEGEGQANGAGGGAGSGDEQSDVGNTSGGEGEGQQQGAERSQQGDGNSSGSSGASSVAPENEAASNDGMGGHVINTSHVPNHYFDVHDHSQHSGGGGEGGGGGGENSGGQEQGAGGQDHQQGTAGEEKKAEAGVENAANAGQDSGGEGHQQMKGHDKKHKKVQKEVVKHEKKHQEVKKEVAAVIEEKKKVEPEKVEEVAAKPHDQDQHKHKKSKHQHIEVHQHKHFELHKHINLHTPEGQLHQGHQEHQEEEPIQEHHNDGYHQPNLMGHELVEPQDHYEHQPMHGEHEHEHGYHGHPGIPIKEEWSVAEPHPISHEKPVHGHDMGAFVIEDHSELEKHQLHHPMEVGYKEEVIHHPHGLGLTPSAAYGLMGAFSAPSASHSTKETTNNNKTTRIKHDNNKNGGDGTRN